MDNNYLSWAGEENLFIKLDNISPPDGINDALKLSNCKNIVLRANKVIGGNEDVLDINRGENISVEIEEAVPTGKYVCTVKGGAEYIFITIKNLVGHGKEMDFDIGSWSDQSIWKRTKHVYLNIRTSDGSPVNVRVLHGWKPILVNGSLQEYKIDYKYNKIFIYAYFIYKKLLSLFGK
jgi:hypothetical protein